MSTDQDKQQMKAREFLGLLPLTLAMAGLPSAAPGSYFTESQLEARSTALRNAYKAARALMQEVTK